MTTIRVGSIAAFHLNETLQTGIITGMEQAFATVLTPADEELRLPISRFCLISTRVFDVPNSSPHDALHSFLSGFSQQYETLTPALVTDRFPAPDLPLNWQDYAQCLGNVEDTQLFAHFYYIRSHPELFSWRKDTIRIRSEAEQKEYQHKAKQQQARDSFLQRVRPYIEAAIARLPLPHLDPQDLRALGSDLSQYLLHNEALDLIRLITHTGSSEATEDKIRKLRICLHEIDPDTDQTLADSGLPVTFRSDLPLTLNENSLPYREIDNVFSIDDNDSEDFDDAVSCTSTEKGFTFGIHITAVSSLVPLDSEIYDEALSRVSSLYLTPGVTPLFPAQLSNDKLSLRAGETRPCLSLFVDTDKDYQITGHRFDLVSLRIASNRSYRDIDKDAHLSPIREILAFSRSLAKGRENNTRTVDRGYTYLLRLSSGKLSMRRIDHQAPSRMLVEEIMVLFNRLFAQYALDHHLPMIFRNVSKIPDNADNNGFTATQAYISTQADYHPGIGSNAYLHATSPIRRITDLINQYQISGFLSSGNPPFSREDLDKLVPGIESRLLLQREIIHASERYWMLRYLEQEYLHNPLPGVILKHSRQGVIIELSDWQKRILVKTDSRTQAGREIQLVITATDPDKGYAIGDIVC